MEIDKFNELRNCIIKNTIKNITSKYTVTNGNDKVTIEQLEKDLLTKNKCIGVNSNAHQCSKNSLPNENYCNIHYIKYRPKKQDKQDNQQESEIEDPIDINNFTKKLIDNEFYYIDINSNYIYNYSGFKVGIIKNERYILSDDPFILGS